MIVFFAISTGIDRFRLQLATKIAVTEAKTFLERHPRLQVIFACFSRQFYDCDQAVIKESL